MQQYKRPGSSLRRFRYPLRAKWLKAAAYALVPVLLFAALWFGWLQPEKEEASPPLAATTPIPTPMQSPLLQAAACNPGDTGETVRDVQDMLIALGFDPGKADGVYGEKLEVGVRNFQLYAGLPVTGVADDETAAALMERWYDAQQPPATVEQPLAGFVIGIDPGHQQTPNPQQEPISPHSNIMKDKVSIGTVGQYTGVPEYVVNLQVALKLKAALQALGARVVMTRETHNVDISNAQRAAMMNEAGVDCWLRVHANYSADSSEHGMFILVPQEGGLDTDDASVVAHSVRLADALLESTREATGADSSRGLESRDDQTGFGWSKLPVCNIEMGYMSNEGEDRLLVTEAYQKQIVDGLTAGFVRYFSGIDSAS